MVGRFGGGKTYSTNSTRAIALDNGMNGLFVLERVSCDFQAKIARKMVVSEAVERTNRQDQYWENLTGNIMGNNVGPNDQGRMSSTLVKETVSNVRDDACLSVLYSSKRNC